ncbi:MAG: rRNA maturation RNase YbeY [Flavobacteriales bacterium]|jgi:probable rRNA maturation factor|nr:rRNA maturation RNase YbeY [Flavobacteriales bacterium]|tara:strand:+ start:2210 stop:2620 length:411 start_codon:yes stop_codon:yes gene_type:complete
MINFQINSNYKLKEKRKIKTWLIEICIEEGYSIGVLSYLLVNDKEMITYNKKFLNHHTLTDVITFQNNDKEMISGDIIISTERVLDNSNKFNVEFIEELYRVMAHGLLHLLGYNDKKMSETKKIREKEDYYLKKIL